MVGAEAPSTVALDSNFLVRARRESSEEGRRLEGWLKAGEIVHVSAIAWSEYRCGPLAHDELVITRKLISSIDAFTEQDADLAATLFNDTGRRSRTHADCMIAAHAIRRAAALATNNMADFRPFQKFGLQLA
ncbi:hypothetical protein BH20VER2_BH20VER2_11450 [soil metagenome]|nr:PIN domain-containing protein [Chthoniobacterales bacterium]